MGSQMLHMGSQRLHTGQQATFRITESTPWIALMVAFEGDRYLDLMF